MQKRLLLGNLDNLHSAFLNKHPNSRISLSAFKALRPQQCIPVGPKGTHNVCVCKIHGNIRLKHKGLKEELARKHFNLQYTYRDFFKAMICLNPTADCYLSKCKNCPGPDEIFSDIREALRTYNIENISFNQWLTTDRYGTFKCTDII